MSCLFFILDACESFYQLTIDSSNAVKGNLQMKLGEYGAYQFRNKLKSETNQLLI